jgi:alkylhydroperoxidase/carboxymuconolactone decarboxylase family protein YurZ
MGGNPWKSGVFTQRFVELVAVAVSCACTSLDGPAAERHIAAALAAGASRDEILTVIKMGAVMSIHSCSLAAPILLEEAQAAGKAITPKTGIPTPACNRMREMGQWNQAWDPFFALDPGWTDQVMAAGAGIYASGVFTPKEVELLSIAFDASFTHMYAPGTRRHIKGALAAGATIEEIFEVLKVCVSQGLESVNLAVPLLAAALAGPEGVR